MLLQTLIRKLRALSKDHSNDPSLQPFTERAFTSQGSTYALPFCLLPIGESHRSDGFSVTGTGVAFEELYNCLICCSEYVGILLLARLLRLVQG